MKPAVVMENGDRSIFRHQASRHFDQYPFDDPQGDRISEGRKDRQRSKKAFKEMRIRRSRAYHRGKKKWRTVEVRESAAVKAAREFYLHCKAKEGKMRYRITGDVLRAFSVEVESDVAFNTLSNEQQKERVADELTLRRFGREEDVRIDEVRGTS